MIDETQDETPEERAKRLGLTPSAPPPPPTSAPEETPEERMRRLFPPKHSPTLMESVSTAGHNLLEMAKHPIDTFVLGPLTDIKTALSPVQGTAYKGSERFGTGLPGAFQRLPDGTIIDAKNTPNSVPEDVAKRAAMNTVVNSVTANIPGLGPVAQHGLSAAVGAYYSPEDRVAGALTGLAAPAIFHAAGKVTGATARAALKRVSPLDGLDLNGVTSPFAQGSVGELSPVVRGAEAADVRPGFDVREHGVRPPQRSVMDAPNDIIQTLDNLLKSRDMGQKDFTRRRRATGVESDALPPRSRAEDAVVPPNPTPAPIAPEAFPEGYQAVKDAPLPEVQAIPGQAKVFVDPEVKASRVEGETIDTAEQRDAERRMSAEARALDAEKAKAEADALAAQEKATRDAQRQAEKDAAAQTKAQQKAIADAAREADKAAQIAQRAASAAAKAAQKQADTAAREAAKTAGTLDAYNKQKAAEKAAQIAQDAQSKAALAAQAAQDATAKRAQAEAIASAVPASASPATAAPPVTPPELPAPDAETHVGMFGAQDVTLSPKARAKAAAQRALARVNAQPDVAPGTPAVEPPAAPQAPDLPGPKAILTYAPEAPAASPVPVEPAKPTLSPAEDAYFNFKTLGIDPSKPDALNMTTSARLAAAIANPEMQQRFMQERGYQSWAEGNTEAAKKLGIAELGLDPKSVDRQNFNRLSGHEIHALKAPLRENAALMEGISRALEDGNLSPEDTQIAHDKLDQLEHSNNELLSTIIGESAQKGRDLNALRQVANMTLDPAVWLVKAKRALGDKPMTADIHAELMDLIKQATDACGGG